MSIRNDPYMERRASLAEVLAIGRDAASTGGAPGAVAIPNINMMNQNVQPLDNYDNPFNKQGRREPAPATNRRAVSPACL